MSAFPLTTKLISPQLRPNLVPRPQIIQRLNDGLVQVDGFARQLTLVSAPAGFGKTTQVTAWLQQVPQRVTWLTLDAHDNDPSRFLSYVVAAVQQVDPQIGQTALALLASPQPPPVEMVLTALINDIAHITQPFFLVLDDYHKIQTRAVHDQLRFVLEHQPRTMHLVVITREDPLLPISLLRARHQVTELRQADLRFDSAEVTEFFRRTAGLDLPPTVVVMLEDCTEGWVTGLQLAALSLHQQDDIPEFVRSLASSDRFILDFLFDEVLSRQPPAVQDFLVRTSILDRLCGPLCDAVTQHTGSATLLQTLEQNNLFVVPLDHTRTWFRYHHLFAELLRHRLRLAGEPTVEQLHVRASQWYEAQNQPFDALQHALAGQVWPRAAALINQLATTMLRRGQVTTLLTWLQTIPAGIVRSTPGLCFAMAWAQLLTGQLDQAEEALACAEQLAGADEAARSELLVAQVYLARARGKHELAIACAQEALRVLPVEDTMSRSIVTLSLGLAHIALGHVVEAEQALHQAHTAAQATHNHYGALTALSLLSGIQLLYGRLHQAAAMCRQVLSTGAQLPSTAMVRSVMGALFYEWNDLAAAADCLQLGIEQCQSTGNADVLIDCLVSMARVHLAQGNHAAARTVLTQAQDVVTNTSVAPAAPGKVAAGWTALALTEGDTASAHFWAEQTAHSPALSLVHARFRLAPVYLLHAQGHHTQAATALQQLWEPTWQAGMAYILIDLRVLQALTAPTAAAATRFVHEALAMAEPEGYVRTFLDKGPPLANLLRALHRQDPNQTYVNHLLAAFENEQRPANTAAPPRVTVASASPADHRGSPLIEPLTGRELEILHLLADGLNNEQIAGQLFITVGTVKTHLHRIYGKLDVQSRTQAVARARTLRLF